MPPPHETQAEAAKDGWYFPVEHEEQALAPLTEKVPAEQTPVTAIKPVEAQNEPAGHAEQLACPVPGS